MTSKIQATELPYSLSTIARERGKTEMTRASGLRLEALNKALCPASLPRFDKIARVCNAQGVKLVTQPMQASGIVTDHLVSCHLKAALAH